MKVSLTPEQQEKISRIVAWTKRKVQVDIKERELYFEEREIWWTSLGENIGVEANGKHDVFERPVIVLKKFSRNFLFAIPVTTKPKSGNWFHRFVFRGEERWAVLAQARVMSSKRLVRRMDRIDPESFSEIRSAFIALIQTDPPAR